MKVKILILALSIVTLAGCGNDESPLGDTTGIAARQPCM